MMGFSLTPMVRNLLLLNILVFAAQNLLFNEEIFQHFTGLHSLFGQNFAPYQLLTHLFVHGNFRHLLGNMLLLLFLGQVLEQVWGPKRFLVFYLVCGFGASMIYMAWRSIELYQMKMAVHEYLLNPTPAAFQFFMQDYFPGFYLENYSYIDAFQENPTSPQYIAETKRLVSTIFQEIADRSKMFGASGAVFGILVAAALLFPDMEILVFFIPMRIKVLALLYGLYELYAIVAANPNDNVAHWAHIGGALFGYLFVRYWKKAGGSVF